MRLDRLLQTLLPKDTRFYAMFEKAVHNIADATDELKKLPVAQPHERESIIARITDFEHAGDQITHDIFDSLNRTFVTPFDSEDIHLLTSELDDILDNIDGSARRSALYKIERYPTDMCKLIDTLHASVRELETGIPLLRNFRNAAELRRCIERVNELENEADLIFTRGISQLFEDEKNPVDIIKLKEVFVSLETATDKCEDVADVLETLLIKHG